MELQTNDVVAGVALTPPNLTPLATQGSVTMPTPESGAALLSGTSENTVVTFDIPLEEVYVGIGEAFGQMIATSLRSSKWDKRSQALKAMTTVLKGLDLRGMAPPGSTGVLGKGLKLRDRIRCWRLSCQLMSYILRDKVMPVRLAAHDLFVDTFSNTENLISQEEITLAVNTLFEPIVEKLGDSNLRLHESARKCVLFTAERAELLGVESVLSKLHARLVLARGKSSERTKVFSGVLDTVNFLLTHFPEQRCGSSTSSTSTRDPDANEEDHGEIDGFVIPTSHRSCEGPLIQQAWTQAVVAPFVEAGMDDALGPRVRSIAVALAVNIYQSVGSEAMQPLLDGLRPAVQTLLKQKFQEADGDSKDCRVDNRSKVNKVGGAIVVRGASAKPPPGHTLPPLQSSPLPFLEDDEECLMDGILEEVGLVFNGTGITGVNLIDEEQQLLEEELLGLGVNLENIDEQQALLSSLQSNIFVR